MLRLGLLVALAALFALIPMASASAAEFKLTINVEGEGVVWCEVDGFNEGECEKEKEYEAGAEITLVAEPESEWELVGLTGCDVVTNDECKVTLSGNRTVTATFAPEPTERMLTVKKTGAGEVKCEAEVGPETCKPTYPKETEVTLYAVPAPGGEFLGWGGDCAGAGKEDSCTLEMGTTDHLITAAFSGEEEPGGGAGSSGNGESSTRVAPVTLPAPIVAVPGKAKISGAGLYKGGKAVLRISCKGGSCKGTVKLIARLDVGHKTKRVIVGQASFSLKAGASKALTIRLSAPAKRLLGKGRTLTAKASGPGVIASTVKIKPTQR